MRRSSWGEVHSLSNPLRMAFSAVMRLLTGWF